MPSHLLKEKKNKIKENYSLEEINYQGIALRDNRPFSWEIKQNKSAVGELPIKLYNIEKDQVELTKNNPNIQNYATLSYVWGQLGKIDKNTI
jgi:hypothetical protein